MHTIALCQAGKQQTAMPAGAQSGYAPVVSGKLVDDVLDVIALCAALLIGAAGIRVLVTGQIPVHGWFLAGWRGYPA